MIAVRDNERGAAVFGVCPAAAKLGAFAIAGGVAGLAGACSGACWSSSAPSAFGPEESLQIVAITIIGGLGSVAGPILGAVYVVGLPAALR